METGSMIRVLLADDEQLIRQGLRRLLELTADMSVVAEAADGEQVFEALSRTQVDVIALDVRMPRTDGLQVLDRLKTWSEPPACLVLTTFDDPSLLLEAARRGAHGFISKDISLEELCAALRAVAAGASWFQPALTSSLRHSFEERHRNGELARSFESLTAREVEVLRLMAGGFTNREIALTLKTAEGTVKNQVSSILGKMGVKDRTLAVLTAIESGLV
jgi:DNA-binding NarL/FixJ family response regulator